MVVDYLVTAEGLGKKLKSNHFTKGMIDWLQIEVKKILKSNESAAFIIEQRLGVKRPKRLLLTKTEKMARTGYQQFLAANQNTPIEQLLPKSLQKSVEDNIENVTNYILERGQAFLQSPEGKDKVSIMIDRFLLTKGTLGNMVSMFLGNERLVDKVQPELIKFLKDQGTNELLHNLLQQEWTKLKQKKLTEIASYLNEEEIVSFIVRTADTQIPFFKWLEQPMNQWSGAYENYIDKNMIPKAVDVVVDLLTNHLDVLLERFHLDDIVREQVQAFSVERLEELVLSISKREFKMITYLGAALGGIIGLIQGFIVTIIG
jgi:uncharacterized membrane protein YheB (UPF0754 family)